MCEALRGPTQGRFGLNTGPSERGSRTHTLGVGTVHTDAGTNVGAVVRSVLVWLGPDWDRLAGEREQPEHM